MKDAVPKGPKLGPVHLLDSFKKCGIFYSFSSFKAPAIQIAFVLGEMSHRLAVSSTAFMVFVLIKIYIFKSSFFFFVLSLPSLWLYFFSIHGSLNTNQSMPVQGGGKYSHRCPANLLDNPGWKWQPKLHKINEILYASKHCVRPLFIPRTGLAKAKARLPHPGT